MIINHANLSILNQAFNGAFRLGLQSAAPMWSQLATLVPSTTSEEKYGWLGNFTKFREWVGERQYQNLKAHDYSIKNKTFENTITVIRSSNAYVRVRRLASALTASYARWKATFRVLTTTH